MSKYETKDIDNEKIEDLQREVLDDWIYKMELAKSCGLEKVKPLEITELRNVSPCFIKEFNNLPYSTPKYEVHWYRISNQEEARYIYYAYDDAGLDDIDYPDIICVEKRDFYYWYSLKRMLQDTFSFFELFSKEDISFEFKFPEWLIEKVKEQI